MAQTASFIVKNEELPISQDFERLMGKGIEMAKRLSGSIWTDYNVHDPGVTVLEQLCYAIMEMSYKANFDFEDLFFARRVDGKASMTLKDYFLLKKEDVSFTNPVTPLDYRKWFLDREFEGVSKLENIWLRPDRNQKVGSNQIITHLKSAVTEEEICKRIINAYNSSRNFGEICSEVIILEDVPIQSYFKVDIDKINSFSDAEVIAVISDFFTKIHELLSPSIRFAKMLQDLGLNSDELKELYHGPKPEKKFIHPEDIKNSSWERMTANINLDLFVAQHRSTWKDLIQLRSEDGQSRILQVIKENKIHVFDGMAFIESLGIQNRQHLISALETSWKNLEIIPLLNGKVVWDHYEPKSSLTIEELSDYYSIQHTFPANYQLGQDKLDTLKPEQSVQVKNLQAYLLLFESLLIDFLVKLVNFPQYLRVGDGGFDHSLDTFWDILIHKVPGSKGLIGSQKEKISKLYNEYSLNLEQKINLRTYTLQRYGEEFNINLIKKAWGEPEDFNIRWFKRIGEIMAIYEQYSAARHTSYNINDLESDFPLSPKLSALLDQDYDVKNPSIFLVERILLSTQSDTRTFGDIAVIIDLDEIFPSEDAFTDERGLPVEGGIPVEEESLSEEAVEQEISQPAEEGHVNVEENAISLMATKTRREAILELLRGEFPFFLKLKFFFLHNQGRAIPRLSELFELGEERLISRQEFKSTYAEFRKELAS